MAITFELNGTTFTRKDNGYCFMEQDGKKTRISKADFETAHDQWMAGAEAEFESLESEETEDQPEVDLEAIATETANRIANYEHTEDAAEREDSFNTPDDVRDYADQFGWYDEIECDADLSDDEMDELNEMITKKVIDLLFPAPKAKKTKGQPATINEHGLVDCSGCSVKDCPHRGAMRRNPTEVGGLGLCPRLKTKEPEKKAKKKARKSKNAFHTSVVVPGLTLTEKQVSFILHLSDTCFWEHGLDSCIWVDCLCDEITGEFQNKPMTVGAMISTLCEKGLGSRAKDRINGKKATSFALTETGKLVAAEVGLS